MSDEFIHSKEGAHHGRNEDPRRRRRRARAPCNHPSQRTQKGESAPGHRGQAALREDHHSRRMAGEQGSGKACEANDE